MARASASSAPAATAIASAGASPSPMSGPISQCRVRCSISAYSARSGARRWRRRRSTTRRTFACALEHRSRPGDEEDAQAMTVRIGGDKAAAEIHLGRLLQDGQATLPPIVMGGVDRVAIGDAEADLAA